MKKLIMLAAAAAFIGTMAHAGQSGAEMLTIKAKLAEKIEAHRPRTVRLIKEYGVKPTAKASTTAKSKKVVKARKRTRRIGCNRCSRCPYARMHGIRDRKGAYKGKGKLRRKPSMKRKGKIKRPRPKLPKSKKSSSKLQGQLGHQSTTFTAISNALKARHDMAKNNIRNTKR